MNTVIIIERVTKTGTSRRTSVFLEPCRVLLWSLPSLFLVFFIFREMSIAVAIQKQTCNKITDQGYCWSFGIHDDCSLFILHHADILYYVSPDLWHGPLVGSFKIPLTRIRWRRGASIYLQHFGRNSEVGRGWTRTRNLQLLNVPLRISRRWTDDSRHTIMSDFILRYGCFRSSMVRKRNAYQTMSKRSFTVAQGIHNIHVNAGNLIFLSHR